MRSAVVQLSLLLVAITSVHAVKMMQSSSLQGKVFPAEGASHVWAIQGKDSVNIKSIDGDFYYASAPGCWKVVVEARRPYKSIVFETLEVKGGQMMDLGRICLQKEAPVTEISQKESSALK